MTLKEIVQGTADLNCVLSGGIAVYILTDVNGKKYQIEIDLSDRHDVGVFSFTSKPVTLTYKDLGLYKLKLIKK